MLACGVKATMGEATSRFSLQSYARRGWTHERLFSPPILAHILWSEKFQMVQQAVEQEFSLTMVRDGELMMVKSHWSLFVGGGVLVSRS